MAPERNVIASPLGLISSLITCIELSLDMFKCWMYTASIQNVDSTFWKKKRERTAHEETKLPPNLNMYVFGFCACSVENVSSRVLDTRVNPKNFETDFH